jgi:DNA-directed RNA polymerase subunit RPC12/RpoP
MGLACKKCNSANIRYEKTVSDKHRGMKIVCMDCGFEY